MTTATLPTILVIDDEVNVLNAIKRTLRSEGFDVQVSANPVEAVELAKQIKPDAVVCDMRMPGMDGAQVLSALRADNPECARILLTGYADINSTIAAINEGQIDRYLTKPWNDEELREVLRQQIGLVYLRRERDALAASLAEKVDALEVLNRELDQRVAARTQELHQTNLFLEQSYKELHTQFLNSVKVFSNLIEMSSPAMAGHSRRVGELARHLAIQMNLPEAEVQDVYVAGLLHDIGKIGLPEAVLATPYTQLDGFNRQLVCSHPGKGQLALMALPELSHVATYVALHHERLDGKGFPDGLEADDIPRGARILAVAEDWDELQMGLLTSQKLNHEQVLEFIQRGVGKRYDAAVVQALPAALLQLQAMPKDNEQLTEGHLLVPGQRLSRDLIGTDGLLLMPKGSLVSSRLVQHLLAIHQKDGTVIHAYYESRPLKAG